MPLIILVLTYEQINLWALGASVHNWNRQHGFSLIEMILTLSILTALLAVSAPSYLDSRKTALIENAAMKLLSVLEIGQSEALKRQKEVYVHYIPSTGSDDGCLALSIIDKTSRERCEDNNGMPKFVLKADDEFDIFSKNDKVEKLLFNFSPITGMPSRNTTIQFTTDDKIEKMSGVLVRSYAGLRGCSNTSVKGWEACQNAK